MSDSLIITLPNNGERVDRRYQMLCASIREGDFCDARRFDVPDLPTGTLDSLMILVDDLKKMDDGIGSLVKKIDQQYFDVAGSGSPKLTVNNMQTRDYLSQFSWDHTRYGSRRQIHDLAATMQSNSQRIEEDLRQLSSSCSEKAQELQNLRRRVQTGLAQADLSDVLTDDVLRANSFLNTDCLVTVLAVVPETSDEFWNANYHDIGTEIAMYGVDWLSANLTTHVGFDDGNYGPESSRKEVRGSPVVLGSNVKLTSRGETAIYSIVLLKGHYEAGQFDGESFQQGFFTDYIVPFRESARSHGIVIRDFDFTLLESMDNIPNENKGKSKTSLLIESCAAQVEVQKSTLIRWCQIYFAEALICWFHLKIIRSFVESVLRYGPPPDFMTVIINVRRGRDKSVHDGILRAMKQMSGLDYLLKEAAIADEEDEEDDAEEFPPFVCIKANLDFGNFS